MLVRNSKRDGRKGDKLQQRFIGLYKIAENKGKGTYRIRSKATGKMLKKLVNACRMKRFIPPNKPHANRQFKFEERSLFQLESPSPVKKIQ